MIGTGIGTDDVKLAGAKEFECIGVSPPHDHPHVYIDMANQDTQSSVHTVGHVSASIRNWGHSRPIRLTAYSPDWNANAPMGKRPTDSRRWCR